MALPVIGDSKQNKSVTTTPIALAVPVVTKAALLVAANPINDTAKSGKKFGGLFLAQDGANLTLVTASGSLTTSTWITVGAATSVTYATPA